MFVSIETTAESPSSDAGDGEAQTVSQSRERRDDMSRHEVTAVPRNRDSDDHMSSSITAIEARIEELEAELARVAPIALERDRLLRARAALLDEPPPATFRAPRRVSQDDVAAVLEQNPGLRAGEIARALGAGQPAISAHLYRGKNARFESTGGRWFLRASAENR